MGIDLNRTAYPNASGLTVRSSHNTIRDNTISGVASGIIIGDPLEAPTGTEYLTNWVTDNRIGPGPDGVNAVQYGNGFNGVVLGAGAREQWIGPGNVISGNASVGVLLQHSTTSGNVVFGNQIGPSGDGTVRIGNGIGVAIAGGAHGNAIGGSWGGNEISGNSIVGVSLGLDGAGPAVSNWVVGNIIGLNATQTESLGTQMIGVAMSNDSYYNAVQSNAIAGHTQHGVCLWNAPANAVDSNFIGMSGYGVPIANGGYGLCFINSANDWARGNAFGANDWGNLYQFNSPGLTLQ